MGGVVKGSLYMIFGLLIAGTLGFAFNVLSARLLGTTGFGILSTAFFLVMVVGGTSGMGVMQTISKSIAESKYEKFGKILIPQDVLLTSVAVTVATVLFVYFMTASLFDESIRLAVTASVAAFMLLYTVQGIFQGYDKMHVIALIRVLINVLKVLGLFIFVVLLGLGALGGVISLFFSFSIVMVLFLVYLLVLNSTSEKVRYPVTRSLKMFANIFATRFFISIIVFLPPVLVRVFGGSFDDVAKFTSVFSTSKYAVYFFTGFLIALFPNLVSVVSSGNRSMEKKYITGSLAITVFFAILMSATSYLFGANLIRIVYGADFVPPSTDILLIFTSVGVFMVSMLLNDIYIAKSDYRTLMVVWFVSLTALVAALMMISDPLKKVEYGILVYAFLSAVMLVTRTLRDILSG